MIFKKVKESKVEQIIQNMMVIIKQVKSMDKELIFEVMDPNTQVTGKTIKLQDM